MDHYLAKAYADTVRKAAEFADAWVDAQRKVRAISPAATSPRDILRAAKAVHTPSPHVLVDQAQRESRRTRNVVHSYAVPVRLAPTPKE